MARARSVSLHLSCQGEEQFSLYWFSLQARSHLYSLLDLSGLGRYENQTPIYHSCYDDQHRSSLFTRPPRPTSAYSTTTTSGEPHQPHCRQSFFSHLLEHITRRDRVSIGPHAFCNSLTSCSCPTPAGCCCLTSVSFTSWMHLECAHCTCIALLPVPAAKTAPFCSCCLL